MNGWNYNATFEGKKKTQINVWMGCKPLTLQGAGEFPIFEGWKNQPSGQDFSHSLWKQAVLKKDA